MSKQTYVLLKLKLKGKRMYGKKFVKYFYKTIDENLHW